MRVWQIALVSVLFWISGLFIGISVGKRVYADDGSLKSATDKVIGWKVYDNERNVVFKVTPTPSGDYVVRDPKYNYPVYKVEKGNIYNYEREKVLGIEKDKTGQK